jgi:hypothetical protein
MIIKLENVRKSLPGTNTVQSIVLEEAVEPTFMAEDPTIPLEYIDSSWVPILFSLLYFPFHVN